MLEFIFFGLMMYPSIFIATTGYCIIKSFKTTLPKADTFLMLMSFSLVVIEIGQMIKVLLILKVFPVIADKSIESLIVLSQGFLFQNINLGGHWKSWVPYVFLGFCMPFIVGILGLISLIRNQISKNIFDALKGPVIWFFVEILALVMFILFFVFKL